MRVWLVNHYAVAPGDPGGTRHFSLARELIGRGHEVTIFSSSFNYVRRAERGEEAAPVTEEQIEGVPFVWIRTPPYRGNTASRMLNMLAFAWRVLRVAKRRMKPRPDVVIGSSPHLFAALAAERIAARFCVPFVLEVRDIWPQSVIDLGQISPLHPAILLMSAVERHLYRRASRIISVLPLAAGHLVAKGARSDRIAWVPNGVDLSSLPEPDGTPANTTFTAIYAGAHGLANHLDTLLDAAAVLKDRGAASRIHIRLVGDGPEKARLQERVSREGLTNVSFGDVVAKNEVSSLLRSADACIVHLRDSTLFRWGVSPNKLFDYMAAARPVIFAVSTPYDPVCDANAGISVPPDAPVALADALLRLEAMLPAERRVLGHNARRFVEKHHNLHDLARVVETTLADAVRDAS